MAEFKLDQRLSQEQIDVLDRAFTSMPPENQEALRQDFLAWHTREFYEGLIAGYEHALLFFSQQPYSKTEINIHQIMASLANYIKNLPK